MPKQLREPFFNLDSTLCCGQAFRWDKQGEWWFGVIGQNVVKIRQESEQIEFEGTDKNIVRNYFRLEDNLPMILSDINKDRTIHEAIRKFRGLRLLRQEPWECLISFICATYKNIPAIKKMLGNLSQQFGEEIEFENRFFHSFPKPNKLVDVGLKGLSACGLGYRARYVLETAKIMMDDYSILEDLKNKLYEEAKHELLKLPGVGPKVADCVLLFSLEKLEAFPVDIWIKRILERYYGDKIKKQTFKKNAVHESLNPTVYRRLSRFGREYFGKYAGYAQEYLYHYERTQFYESGE
jgi:N-glycosylase/DNA lyase